MARRALLALCIPGWAAWIVTFVPGNYHPDAIPPAFWVSALLNLVGICALFSILTTPIAVVVALFFGVWKRATILVALALAIIGTVFMFPAFGLYSL